MDDISCLRQKLLSFLRAKFSNIYNIYDISEEIVNEAMIRCKSSSNYCADNDNFGYLSRICLNLAIDTYNLQKWEQSNLVEFSDDHAHEKIHTEQDSDFDILDKLHIRESVMELSETEQQIIDLRYYKDLSFKEIAVHTDKKINTVLSIHRRALQKLRPSFQKYFTEDDDEYYSNQTLSKYYKI